MEDLLKGKTLNIQIGVKLSTLLSEIDGDIVSFKNAEIQYLTEAIKLTLNLVPDYLYCSVTAMEQDDTISVAVMPTFSEEADGKFEEWLKRNNVTVGVLQGRIAHALQTIRDMVDNYGRHFGTCLLVLSTY